MDILDYVQEAKLAIKQLTSISQFLYSDKNTDESLCLVKLKRAELVYEDINNKRNSLKLSTLADQQLDQLNDLIEEIDILSDNIQSVNITLSGISPTKGKLNAATIPQDEPENVQFPKIKLPTFSGNPMEWNAFYELFTSLVHEKKKLSKIEKYQYLVTSLSNEPLNTIKHLPLIADNYEIALNILIQTYDDKRVLLSSYLSNIFNAPKATSGSASSLRTLLNTFAENVAALKTYNVDLWDFTLFSLLLQKIDKNSSERFGLNNSDIEVPSYESLYKFVNDQCKAITTNNITANLMSTTCQPTVAKGQYHPAKGHSSPSAWNQRSSVQSRPKQSLIVKASSSGSQSGDSVSASYSCFVCKANHSVYKCESFLNKGPQERFKLIKDRKRCVNCLGGHRFNSCASQSTCHVCHKQHHTLLHFYAPHSDPSVSSATIETTEVDVPQVVASTVAPVTVLLSTALVSITDINNKPIICRALIDNGSQISIMTEKCCAKLGLPLTALSVPIHGIGKASVSSSKGVTMCHISPTRNPSPSFTLQMCVLPVICLDLPSCKLSIDHFEHLKNLPLADPNYGSPAEIDILLGADIYCQIIKPGIKVGKIDEPIAIKTVFGWILSGKVYLSSTSISAFHVSVQDPDASLKRFWELENIPDKAVQSPEDEECEQYFVKNHSRDASGRYTVCLPFREKVLLGKSLDSAMKRLLALESRLSKNPLLRQDYSDFMLDYLNSGHMSALNSESLDSNSESYYIPHHCILKPASDTTKLRVVFDASAKSSNNISLNDTLLTGPKLQPDIVSLLLRFRLHAVVLIADIKQMYRQILIHPQQRPYQRILWRFSPNSPIQHFELNTVTYGVSSAPFLAIRTLIQLANDEQENYPQAAKVLLTDTFVDDVVTGCATVDDALRLQSQLQILLEGGGFQLRKWSTNNSMVLDAIPSSLRHIGCQSFDIDTFQKILGLNWNPNSDVFTYKIDSINSSCTKRAILSEIARIFDPLGLLSPLTLFAKHLIQLLWIQGLDWDDIPSSDICSKWTQYRQELPCLVQLQLPRRLTIDDCQICELHGFCDASVVGYAAAIYIRIVDSNGSIRTSLVCGKSKVAPLKYVTIPRLELCGALLLANLMDFVLKTYLPILSINTFYAWSDSTVALTWIKSPPHRWKTFIANRVAQIQEKISPQHWHYISGAENPADCASRGLLPQQLMSSPLWWAGPEWLGVPHHCWPINQIPPSSEVDLELRSLSLPVTAQVDVICSLLSRFSSLRKVQGSVAYLNRFIRYLKCKEDLEKGPLIHSELHKSLMLIIKHIQKECFLDEIIRIRNKTSCTKSIQRLAPFLDNEDILRVGGRLHHSQASYGAKHPILLPRNHLLTKLLIKQYHIQYMHPGATALQALLMRHYWILCVRRAINHCISSCSRCSRLNPKPYTPLMSNLPMPRVNEAKPFRHTGVDYAGPFTITFGRRRGNKTQKAYLCLFVCLATKALHLELVSDLSTDAFLAALRRFTARRGQCSDLYSDQGTNFIGAHRQLNEYTERASGILAIKWHFNPPSAPHFGGLWEAGVKAVKHHIIRVVGNQILTYEELNTLFHQIEAILNSRPLCPLSNDPNDLQALTPGHFLTSSFLTAPPDEDVLPIPMNRLSRWQLIQQIQQGFWKRWHSEYLHTLQQRSKWLTSSVAPKLDAIVLIKQDNAPPLTWKLARVTGLHPGPDGHVRTATVRTADGTLVRPLIKLCPLPMD